jgi:hypothetical protein
MLVEVALDDDLVLDVWSLDDDGDTDTDLDDKLVLIVEDDDLMLDVWGLEDDDDLVLDVGGLEDDDDLMLDVWGLDDHGDADTDLDDGLVLIVEDDDLPSVVDDKGKLEDDFGVEYLLELDMGEAIFVIVNDLEALDFAREDEGLWVELGTGMEEVDILLVLLDFSVDELLRELDFCPDVEDLELLDLSDELETADLRVDVREVRTLDLLVELEIPTVLVPFDVWEMEDVETLSRIQSQAWKTAFTLWLGIGDVVLGLWDTMLVRIVNKDSLQHTRRWKNCRTQRGESIPWW